MPSGFRLNTRSKPRLLKAMLHALAGDGVNVSFEGSLAESDLVRIDGASGAETAVLKRGTIAPPFDFVVLPLTQNTLPLIERAIDSRVSFKGDRGIVHVQVEREGVLVFAAYDNFHPDLVWVASGVVPEALLDKLVKEEVLRSYDHVEAP